MVPEEQLQTDSKEESFHIISGKDKRKKKGKKNREKILHLLKEETHANLEYSFHDKCYILEH